MKSRSLFLAGLLIGFMIQPVWAAEVVKVGFEPFPPLITKDGKGLSVEMLRAVEKISDLKFDIKIMPYDEAKKLLREKKVDMIGHTPKGKEAKEFYEYAQDTSWSIIAITDIYSMNKENVQPGNFKTLKVIGTPTGNKEFYADQFGIPVDRFREGNLDDLLKMMEKGSIDAFIFERASTMYSIKKLKIKNVNYRLLDDGIQASFGVRKDAQGNQLKDKLDKLIKSIDSQKIFYGYYLFINLRPEGSVPLQ